MKERGKAQFFGEEVDIQQNGEVQNYGHEGGYPSVPPLVGNPDPSITDLFCLFDKMILKRVRESIFFQNNKFTAYKIRDRKEVAKSLTTFNLPKIIHPFQRKKYLRT